MASALRLQLRLSTLYRSTQCSPLQYLTATRSYAKKIVSKVGAQAAQKTRMEVETDPEKLLKYCCGANIVAGEPDPEIKPDSEYPEWLWNLRTERGGPDLSELSPDTALFWKRFSRITAARNMRVNKRLAKLKSLQFPDDTK